MKPKGQALKDITNGLDIRPTKLKPNWANVRSGGSSAIKESVANMWKAQEAGPLDPGSGLTS